MPKNNRIILPLDVDTTDKAVDLVNLLRANVGAFKVGLELVNAAGLGIFDRLRAAVVGKIFYDCKLHDIPNTVAGASRAIVCNYQPWMFNVHCSGGFEMMKAAREASRKQAGILGIKPPLVIGVTVLTSIDKETLNDELRIPGTPLDQVIHFASLAKAAGLDGVVCSPREIEAVRAACGPEFLIVTPGVRPADANVNDQKRVMTPGEATKKGADYLVIGRPIIKAERPNAAARAINKEIDAALAV